MTTDALVRISNLVKHFDISGGILDRIAFSGGIPYLATTTVKAINSVSLDIHPGEILSVVGESGCGKSTLGRTVLGLYAPTGGEIFFRGRRLDNLSHADMLPYRRKMQMVFQDPYASLNPRMTVRQILQEPVRFHFPQLSASEVRDKVTEVMRQVGVDPAWAGRFPHEFSGGQRQRISIARALMVDPEFIVADEPISALDVSIQAQILNLIMDCQERFGLTYMFINPRPVRGGTHQHAGGGHVPGHPVRTGGQGRPVPDPATPLFPRPALGHPKAWFQGFRPHPSEGRGAHTHPSARRLCLPPALSVHGRALPARSPAAAALPQRQPGRLSRPGGRTDLAANADQPSFVRQPSGAGPSPQKAAYVSGRYRTA